MVLITARPGRAQFLTLISPRSFIIKYPGYIAEKQSVHVAVNRGGGGGAEYMRCTVYRDVTGMMETQLRLYLPRLLGKSKQENGFRILAAPGFILQFLAQ